MSALHSRLFIVWEPLLAILKKEPTTVTSADRDLIKLFIDGTPDEDEWLTRSNYIDGSHAGLMRSMLAERGTKLELLAALDLYRLRPALRRFVDGKDFPSDLQAAAEVSVTYWKQVVQWEEGLKKDLFSLSRQERIG